MMDQPDTSHILKLLQATADTARAAEMAAYHKTPLPVLGVPNPVINDAVKAWRADKSVTEWLAEADALWASGVFEARIAAPKLLVKARIPDPLEEAAVWQRCLSWAADFDGWAIADHVADAAGRRVMADLTRLDDLEAWRSDPDLWANFWVRRATLVYTLGLAKLTHPSEAQAAARARVLTWAEGLATDHQWFIQKAIGWWLRTLAPREPDTVRAFVDAHGDQLRAVARKEALRALPPAD